MSDRFDTLGLRIIQAARMAVSVHLNQGTESCLQHGRRVVIGGAGPKMMVNSSTITDLATDGVSPVYSADGAAA
jgi:hypothetical protein